MKITKFLLTIPLYAKPLQLGLLVAAALTFLCEKATAQAPIDLGQATSFAVLAGAGITFAGPPNSTDITGDIGSYSTATITGLEKVILVGVNHAGDTTTQQAKTDLALAYTSASTLSATTTSTTLDLGSETRAPGVYQATTTIGLSGTLTLDAGGNPAAVWVFQAGTALTTATSSKIVLLNGAKASNIFWTIGSSATLGTYTEFAGTVMAYTSITLTTGV